MMRPRHVVTLLVVLALAAVLAPTPAQAGGIVSVCDEAHLLAALAGGGTVTFSCSGTIPLTATITISADTTIDGSGQIVTISGSDAVRVFTVNEGMTLSLNKLTVADGFAVHGGGIYSRGALIVRNSTFSDNRAIVSILSSGGAIYSSGGTLTVSNSIFSSNRAEFGAGIFNCNGGTLAVSNTVFSDNSANSQGGGIYSEGAGGVTVSASVFSSNVASQGGGIFSYNSPAEVSESTFSGNHAYGEGAGIGRQGVDGTMIVSNTIFSGNSATSGGGIINEGLGMLTVNSSFFFDNNTTRDGGGIANAGRKVIVNNSTFSNNRSDWGGGGIHNFGYYSTVTVSNSTFSGNSTTMYGGAIYNEFVQYGAVNVSNSTFSGNSAPSGGSICNSGDAVVLNNTVVAYSSTGSNCAGAITDGGGNLSYPDTTCPGINSDPKLGPLQNNLGPTQTMALLPGSAALEAGNDAICAAAPVNNLDQRGITRPQGLHCDIGAFEATLQPIARVFLPMIVR